jgi:hypothetical protein
METGIILLYDWKKGIGTLKHFGSGDEYMFTGNEVVPIYRHSIRKNDRVTFFFRDAKTGKTPTEIDYVPRTWEHIKAISPVDFSRPFYIGYIKDPGAFFQKPGAKLSCKDPRLGNEKVWLFYRRFMGTLKDEKINAPILFLPVEGGDDRNKYESVFGRPIYEAPKEQLFKVYNRDKDQYFPELGKYLKEAFGGEELNCRLDWAIADEDPYEVGCVLDEFRERNQRVPSEKILQLSDFFQILLWVNNQWEGIKYNTILNYFIGSNYQERASALKRCSPKVRSMLIRHLGEQLLPDLIQLSIQKEIKPFLNLLKPNLFGEEEDIYLSVFRDKFYREVRNCFPIGILVDLWLRGYIDKSGSVSELVSIFDAENERHLQLLVEIQADETPFKKKVFDGIFEKIFHACIEKDFYYNYPKLFILLNHLQKKRNTDFQQFLLTRFHSFSPEQQFILSTTGLELYKTPLQFYYEIEKPSESIFIYLFFLAQKVVLAFLKRSSRDCFCPVIQQSLLRKLSRDFNGIAIYHQSFFWVV